MTVSVLMYVHFFEWFLPIQLKYPEFYAVIISLLFLQDDCQYRFLHE